MPRSIPALALLICPLIAPLAAQVQAQEQPLSLEHRMLLRCAATAALVARGQEAGDPAMAAYPEMRQRGREFFIRASVRVMDETGAPREAVEAQLRIEAQDIVSNGTVHQMMPVCLPIIPQ